MRDRLIELLGEFPMFRKPMKEAWMPEAIERLADYLLAKGVIVPPMRLGQTCFSPCEWRNEVDECKVSSILQKAAGSWKIRITNFHYRSVFEITPNKIGKTVFLTREEAEKALERSENGKS